MGKSRRLSYREQKEWYWGMPVPEGIKHGPASFAAKAYGCPCSTCLPSGKRSWKNTEGATRPKTKAERDRALRESKRGQPVPPDVKHGRYARKVYHCPRDVCKNAESVARRRVRWAWLETAHGRWQQVGPYKTGIDVICWPPRNAGPDWQCPDPSHKESAAC